jgi:hypothetical protein
MNGIILVFCCVIACLLRLYSKATLCRTQEENELNVLDLLNDTNHQSNQKLKVNGFKNKLNVFAPLQNQGNTCILHQ